MRPANERRCYIVTSSLIGWAHTQNDPWPYLENVQTLILSCCQLGEYSNGTACVPCPLGYRCPSPSGSPIECADGYYQDAEGQISCQACDAGASCLDKTVAPVDCNAGWFSLLGEMTCEVSWIGTYVIIPLTHWPLGNLREILDM